MKPRRMAVLAAGLCLSATILLIDCRRASAKFATAQIATGQPQVDQVNASPPVLTDATAAEIKRVLLVFKSAAQDGDPAVRASALSSLPFFATYDESVIELLIDAASDENADVRQTALETLLTLNATTENLIDAMLVMAGDESLDPLLRNRLLERLEDYGPAAVVPRAIAALYNNENKVRANSISLLSRFGRNARSAINPLLTLATDDAADSQLRASAFKSVEIILNAVTSAEVTALKNEQEWGNITDQLFGGHDTNRDGRITMEELPQGQFIVAINNNRAGRGRNSISFLGADANRDGAVTRDELLVAIAAAM